MTRDRSLARWHASRDEWLDKKVADCRLTVLCWLPLEVLKKRKTALNRKAPIIPRIKSCRRDLGGRYDRLFRTFTFSYC
jgi:hypothetical protein